MDMSLGIYQFMGTTVDNMINHIVIQGAQNLMSSISPFVTVSVTIYIMILGYNQIMGKSNQLAIDVFYSCLAIICITSLSLNAGNYTHYVMGLISALGDGLTNALMGGKQQPSIYSILDSSTQQGIALAGQYFSRVDWAPTTWIYAINSLIIFAASIAVTVTAAIIILGTKFLLALLLLVGPLFLTLGIFPTTRKYSENWISKVFENILIQLFGISVIFMALRVMEYILKNLSKDATGNVMALSIPAQILIVGLILVYVIKQIPYLASTLASSGLSAGLLSLTDKLPLRDMAPPKTEAEKYYINQNSIARDKSREAAQNTKHNEISSDLLERIQQHNNQNYD